MKPQKSSYDPQKDLFKVELDRIVHSGHPLAKLTAQMDWDAFDRRFEPYFSENGRPAIATRLMVSLHYLKYSEIPDAVNENRSAIINSYFKNGLFSTGYATHSLFPYRGKFHPQLIKGLINILGIKKGETIIDPMTGSGTTNIEAALMGINSYGIDISPFCQLMTKTKFDALSINLLNLLIIHLSKSLNFMDMIQYDEKDQ